MLRAGERMDGQMYAGIPGAARELTGYGLRVLIDGSKNSLPMELLATKRQAILELEPMPQNTLRSIPEYAGLLKVLRDESLEVVAWLVLGGVPADYDALCLLMACNEPAAYRRVIVKYLRDEISKAISRRGRMLVTHPSMKEVLDEFKTKSEIPEELLTEKGIASPSPNKGLRIVLRGDCVMLVPADAAMALVLRFYWIKTPPIEVLQKLLAYDGGDGAASSEL